MCILQFVPAKRNINLADARDLLKEFHTYDTILTQPDSVLKNLLEKEMSII